MRVESICEHPSREQKLVPMSYSVFCTLYVPMSSRELPEPGGLLADPSEAAAAASCAAPEPLLFFSFALIPLPPPPPPPPRCFVDFSSKPEARGSGRFWRRFSASGGALSGPGAVSRRSGMRSFSRGSPPSRPASPDVARFLSWCVFPGPARPRPRGQACLCVPGGSRAMFFWRAG